MCSEGDRSALLSVMITSDMIFITPDIINVDAFLGHLPMVALEKGFGQVASSLH